MKLPSHKKHLSDKPKNPVGFAVIVTSDSRTKRTDESGQIIMRLLVRAGHECLGYKMISNNQRLINQSLRQFLRQAGIQIVITSGGTGCGKKDLIVESVSSLIVKELPGFGELFRMLSYREIGSAALMSRAFLGITRAGKIVCCLPGSPHAVKLALNKLLLPELVHLVWEINR